MDLTLANLSRQKPAQLEDLLEVEQTKVFNLLSALRVNPANVTEINITNYLTTLQSARTLQDNIITALNTIEVEGGDEGEDAFHAKSHVTGMLGLFKDKDTAEKLNACLDKFNAVAKKKHDRIMDLPQENFIQETIDKFNNLIEAQKKQLKLNIAPEKVEQTLGKMTYLSELQKTVLAILNDTTNFSEKYILIRLTGEDTPENIKAFCRMTDNLFVERAQASKGSCSIQ